jgi:hypothetical protein
MKSKIIFNGIDGSGIPLKSGDKVAVCTGFDGFPIATIIRVMGTVSRVKMNKTGEILMVENRFLVKD